MSGGKTFHAVEEGLREIALFDVHTHLDASHPTARGLHDVLLYHMVVSDLVSAGCPSRERLPEHPDDREAAERIAEAIPYIPRARNTSCAWGLRLILEDLYGWTEPVTRENWRRLDSLIRERSADASWPARIATKAGVRRACTELWRGHGGGRDGFFQFALEWAFFARCQEGVNDIALYELENAWNQERPGPPLPVKIGPARGSGGRVIRTLDDVHAALEHYVSRIPFGEVLSTAQHISTEITYREVDDERMSRALANRERATVEERDVYASYLLEAFLTALERSPSRIVFQFSLGAEPLPFETGSTFRPQTAFELARMIERHPDLHFQVFLSSEHANQSVCTLARELPNLSVAGFWWHSFFPGIIRRTLGDRLDMLAANRQIGYFSDAYCMDWMYAKAILVRKQWARVLAERIEQGQYTVDEALGTARTILEETPQELLGMRPTNGTAKTGGEQ